MVTPELRAYIKTRLEEGAGREDIVQNLRAAGWEEQDIEEAFRGVSPKKRVRFLPVLLASLAGIILLGGGVFAFWYLIKDPPPSEVLARMLESLVMVKSAAYTGSIRFEIGENALEEGELFDLGGIAGFLNVTDSERSEEERVTFSFTAQGANDGHDKDNPKGWGTLDMRAQFSPQERFALGLETRVIYPAFYLQLTRFQIEPAVPFMDFLIDPFLNQWFVITEDDLKVMGAYDTSGNVRFSEEEEARLEEAFKNAKIIRITEEFPNAVIEDMKMFYYGFGLNKEGLRNYLVEVMNVLETKDLTKEEVGQLKEGLESDEFDKALDMVAEGFTGQIWIGKHDFLPYRVIGDLILREEASQKEAAKIGAFLSLKDFNQPLNIEVPAGARSLKEFLEEQFGDDLFAPPALLEEVK